MLPILPNGEGHVVFSPDGKLRALRALVLPSGTRRLLVFGERGLVAVTDSLADVPELAVQGELAENEEFEDHALCYEPAVSEPRVAEVDETDTIRDGTRVAKFVAPDKLTLSDSRNSGQPRIVNIGPHLSTPSFTFAGDRIVVVIGPNEFFLIDWASGRARKVKSGTEDDIDWTSDTIATAEGDAACASLRLFKDSSCDYTPLVDVLNTRFLRARANEHLLCFRAQGGKARLVRIPRVGQEGVVRPNQSLLEGNTNTYTREKLSALSPNGEKVAVIEGSRVETDDGVFHENARLLVFEKNGKTPSNAIDLPRKSADAATTQLDFSADGRHLVLSWNGELFVLRLDTNEWWTLPAPSVDSRSYELVGRFARIGQRYLDLEARAFVWLGVPPLSAGSRPIAFLPNGDVELVGALPDGAGPNIACIESGRLVGSGVSSAPPKETGKVLPLEACRQRLVEKAFACAAPGGD